MSIYGPSFTPRGVSKTETQAGNLDMDNNKIINLAEPRERSDAATLGYVSRFSTFLQNSKVDWSGGTMTGSLSMGDFRLTNLAAPIDVSDATNKSYVDNLDQYLNNRKVNKSGDTMTGKLNMSDNRITGIAPPVDEKDCANKKYVDEKTKHDVRGLGRYIIIPQDGDNAYFSVRSKRNVDLDFGKFVEIKNNSIEKADRTITTILDSINLVQVFRGKDLSIMELNSEIVISFPEIGIPTEFSFFPAPWTILISSKRGNSPPVGRNRSTIEFYDSRGIPSNYLYIWWSQTGLKYAITNLILPPGEAIDNTTTIDLDTSQFHHIAFEYVRRKFVLWLDGISRKSHSNLDLGDVKHIKIGVKQVGIISIYNRQLNKGEIIEHFVDRNVKNFTNDEILI